MDIRKLFSLLKRWIWLLILGMIIGGVCGYYFSSQQTPIYQTSTRFMLYMTNQNVNSTNMDYFDRSGDTSMIIELLASETVIEQTSLDLGFSVSPEKAVASDVINSPFIDLSVKDSNPEHAALIANKLVEVLIDEMNLLQSSQYTLAEQNLEGRIEQMEAQMLSVQDQINEINTATVEDSLSQVQNQIDDLQNQINELDIKIADIDPTFASDEELLELAGYKDKIEQLSPILDLYHQIYTNLVVLRQPLSGNDDTSFSQLDQLETTFELYRQIYINSVASLEKLRLEKDQNKPTVIQTKRASIPTAPILPKPQQAAMLYASIGLMSAAGIAFVVEYLDDTIKTPDDVEKVMGLPVIGFIEDIAHGSRKSKANYNQKLFVSSQPRSMVSEAMRSIRTNLEFYAVDHPLQTVLITSASPREGKSTISANLALIMGQSGKKTLLLDADLRRPNIHKFFNFSNRVGLSDLLISKLEIDQVITTVQSANDISVITSGSLPPNPAELLASEKMAQIINAFRKQFDYIVIDSSPMVVTDSQVIASQVDGLIFVIQPGKTRAHQMIAPMGQLSRINTKVLGVVLNRIPRKLSTYYSGYYYTSSGPADRKRDYFKDETIK
ncbi:MAG: polysaccharide biosynthesis tyrosine autokinase [Chloroflexota bacterium]|nr:polysaccharide biosynthesis tyrosine autokinase [Chloroflexota bacterium]